MSKGIIVVIGLTVIFHITVDISSSKKKIEIKKTECCLLSTHLQRDILQKKKDKLHHVPLFLPNTIFTLRLDKKVFFVRLVYESEWNEKQLLFFCGSSFHVSKCCNGENTPNALSKTAMFSKLANNINDDCHNKGKEQYQEKKVDWHNYFCVLSWYLSE